MKFASGDFYSCTFGSDKNKIVWDYLSAKAAGWSPLDICASRFWRRDFIFPAERIIVLRGLSVIPLPATTAVRVSITMYNRAIPVHIPKSVKPSTLSIRCRVMAIIIWIIVFIGDPILREKTMNFFFFSLRRIWCPSGNKPFERIFSFFLFIIAKKSDANNTLYIWQHPTYLCFKLYVYIFVYAIKIHYIYIPHNTKII